MFGVYNGSDGITPPPYLGRVFDEAEWRYTASGITIRKGFVTHTGFRFSQAIPANRGRCDAYGCAEQYRSRAFAPH
jgi:hypothetical protein